MKHKWLVIVHGKKCSKSWEISVVREDYKHGQVSYGWHDLEKKLLIGHNGGPCSVPVIEFVWDCLIELAYDVCTRLNKGESLLPKDKTVDIPKDFKEGDCPQCGSKTGIKIPANHDPYCEDCGWPDEDFDES